MDRLYFYVLCLSGWSMGHGAHPMIQIYPDDLHWKITKDHEWPEHRSKSAQKKGRRIQNHHLFCLNC